MLVRLLFLALFALAATHPAWAKDPPEVAVTHFGDRFEPEEIAVPIGVKVALKVTNRSAGPVEWESLDLHREKVIPAGTAATIYIGPLRSGSYEYFDDFHPKIRGRVVAR